MGGMHSVWSCPIGNRVVDELVVEAEFRKLRIALLLPAVRLYGHRHIDEVTDAVVVESAEGSEFAVLHAPDGLRLVLDLSLVHLPERSILQNLTFDFGQPVPVRTLELVGEVATDWSLLPYAITIVTKDSGRHRSLLSQTQGGGIITLR